MSEAHSNASLVASLAEAARARLAAWRDRPRDSLSVPAWGVAVGMAALIVAGPVATIAGARLLARGVRAETARIDAQLAPRRAAGEAIARDRATLVALLRQPGLGAAAEALARALPAEASLVRIARNARGELEIEVSAPDPDKVRAAIRGEPALSGLRDAGQRRGDAAMTVLLREHAR